MAIALAACAAGCQDDGESDTYDVSARGSDGGMSAAPGGSSGGAGSEGGESSDAGTRPPESGPAPGTSTALPPDLSGDTALEELDTDDFMAVCDALGARLADAISDEDAARLACTFLALLVSTTPGDGDVGTVDAAMCQQAVDECLASGVEEGTSTFDCDAAGLSAAASECPVTLDEFESCIDAQVALLDALLGLLNCDTLADPEVAEAMAGVAPMDPASVPECARIVAECPALLERGGDAGAMGPGG